MPNLRGKTWTTTTPAYVEDAQFWEDHLISDAVAAKAASSVQTVNSTAPDAQGNVDIVALPSGGTAGQVLTKQSSTEGDADWEDPASSGHTIIDENGDDMPYRKNLQFLNAEVTDDAVNDSTVVDCKGAKGDPGQAATITVGTVTTLPAGSSATVTNMGTSSAAIFDFGIPKGADGTGAGDMLKTDYDPNSVVELAGGIPDYVTSQAYTLPTAASNVLGGVKVGTNLSIDASGVLSATDTNTDELKDLTDVNLTTPTDGQALLYDSASSKWVNGNVASGSGGSIITVTTSDSALYGQTVTITDGTTTLTETLSNIGEATFEGVTLTGSLTVSTTGANPYTLNVPYYGNYNVVLSAFSATITITFPYSNGATCTISDGDTTLTATESPMAFGIPNTGTWVATCTLDGQSKTQSFVITTDGQTESHTFEYGTINLTYANEFRGLTLTCSSGGTTISKVAPSTGNTMVFYPPSTGTWDISGIYNGVTYTTSATVSSLSTAVSAVLQTIPNGSTVTPTDNVQKWLNCAGIFNKNYTTIGQVLADSTTLLALISDNNAVDYMVRSTTWASSVCANSTAMTDIGANDYCANTLLADSTWCNAICNSTYFESVLNIKVPTMTSNTAPSGQVFATNTGSGSNTEFWLFDGKTNNTWGTATNAPARYGYKFTRNVKIYLFSIISEYHSAESSTIKLQYSSDNNTWNDATSETYTFAHSSAVPKLFPFNVAKSINAVEYWSIYETKTSGTIAYNEIQFYGR